MKSVFLVLGILLIAYGLLRYEGEHKKISNFLDELWIKFDDNVLQIQRTCIGLTDKIRLSTMWVINFFFEGNLCSFKNFIRSFFFIKGILCLQISLLYLTYYLKFGNQTQVIGNYGLTYFIPFYKEIHTNPVAINVSYQQNNLLVCVVLFFFAILWMGAVYVIRRTPAWFWYTFTIIGFIALICYDWSMPMGDTITKHNERTGNITQSFYPYPFSIKILIFLFNTILIPAILLSFIKIFRSVFLTPCNICTYTTKIILMIILGYILYCFIILGFFYADIYHWKLCVGISNFLPSVFSPIAAFSLLVFLLYLIILLIEVLLHLANRLVYVLPKYKIFEKDKTFFCLGVICILISLLPTISIIEIMKLIVDKWL